MKRICLFILLATASLSASAQPTWYKINKEFITTHLPSDSAIGNLEANAVSPAKTVHPVSCGGKDGELHIGIAGGDIVWSNTGQPISALADQENSDFGVVAEPVNLAPATKTAAFALAGQAATFQGYYRLWNEGHDHGSTAASNPDHVLELHPAWGFHGGAHDFDDPASIRPMQAKKGGSAFRGYGASKFRTLLSTLSHEEWLHVYEDDSSVFVELPLASNFFQLPVKVNEVHDVTGGVEASVDVFSNEAHDNLVLSGLRVVANSGSRIAQRLKAHEDIQYLLGIFSVNLRKVTEIAAGHDGADKAVFAPSALEFFTYGVPLAKAVASSSPTCTDEPAPD